MRCFNPAFGSYLLVLLLYEVYSTEVFNQYETDNNIYWRSSSPFEPTKGAKYGSLLTRTSMYCEFKMQYFGGKTYGEWENVFRLGKYGNASDCSEHGSRYPGIYILPDEKGLQVSLSDADDCWYVVESNFQIEPGVIYQFTLYYNQIYSTLFLSSKDAETNKILTQNVLLENRTRPTGTDTQLINTPMDIIISDPYNIPADVVLYDMVFVSYTDEFPDLPFDLPTPMPTISPTYLPTHSPSKRPTESPIDMKDDDVQIQIEVSMGYNSNNTNKSADVLNEIIKNITQEIINEYIDEYTNNTGDSVVIIIVIGSDDKNEYDVVLRSNYTTDNETATQLEVLFENVLETELIDKIHNDSSILVNDISVEVTIVTLDDDSSDNISSTEGPNNDILAQNNKMDDTMLLYVLLGASILMICVFGAGFFFGYKLSGRKQQIRLKSHEQISIDNNIGNIIIDHRPKQDSNEDDDDDYYNEEEYDENINGRGDSGSHGNDVSVNNINDEIVIDKKLIKAALEAVITPKYDMINHIKVANINNMDNDDSVEDMFQIESHEETTHTKATTATEEGDDINIVTSKGSNI